MANRAPVSHLTAFLGDIHGDLEALQWALEATADAALRVSLGDVVDGRHDAACMQLLRNLQVVVVKGNHDAWAARETRRPREEREWLSQLPLVVTRGDWIALHSAFRVREGDDEPTWTYLLDECQIRQVFQAWNERLVFCGHSHIPSINVLQADGRVRYLGPDWLRHHREFTLAPGSRYLVCAGCCEECVVCYDAQRLCLSFVFRPQEPLESWLSTR